MEYTVTKRTVDTLQNKGTLVVHDIHMQPQAERKVLDCVLLASPRKRKGSQISMDDDGIPSNLPSIVVARRQPRPETDSDSCQHISIGVEGKDPQSDKSHRERGKRPSSVPPTAKQSHSTAARKRTQSRSVTPGSTADRVAPARKSARLARKIHSFINVCSPDIYAHLADPSGPGSLLSESLDQSMNAPSGSLSAPLNPDKRRRGRPKKSLDLGDSQTRTALMEEWARIRLSQGILPGTSEFAHAPQTSTPSDMRLEASATPPKLLGSDVAFQGNSQVQAAEKGRMRICEEETQLVAVDQSTQDLDQFSPKALHSEESHPNPSSPANLLSSKETNPPTLTEPVQDAEHQPVIHKSITFDERAVPLVAAQPALPHEHAQPAMPSSPRAQSVAGAGGPLVEKAGAVDADEGASDSAKQPPSDYSDSSFQRSDDADMSLDGDFYMFDLNDILTFPWEPLTSHLYVPPSLGQLITGMKSQLVAEARARQNAEAQYEAELRRRLAAEQAVKTLRSKLDLKQNDSVPVPSLSSDASLAETRANLDKVIRYHVGNNVNAGAEIRTSHFPWELQSPAEFSVAGPQGRMEP